MGIDLSPMLRRFYAGAILGAEDLKISRGSRTPKQQRRPPSVDVLERVVQGVDVGVDV